MTCITIERSHALGRERAREKAEALGERLARELGVACQWQGDVLAVRHAGANGQIEVGAERVTVMVKLGLLMGMMAGSIQQQIESALDKALAD